MSSTSFAPRRSLALLSMVTLINKVWLGIFGLALTVAYFPNMSGASVPPRYAALALAMVGLLFLPRIELTRGLAWLLAFCVWALITALWSPVGADAFGSLLLWVFLAG